VLGIFLKSLTPVRRKETRKTKKPQITESNRQGFSWQHFTLSHLTRWEEARLHGRQRGGKTTERKLL